MQLDYICNVDHSACSLRYQCYVAIEIVSKFILIISNFSRGVPQTSQQGHTLHTKCPLHTKKQDKKPHRYTLYKVCWVLPTFPIFVYSASAPNVPPLNVVWICPCNKTGHFSFKGWCCIHEHTHIEAFGRRAAWAIDKRFQVASNIMFFKTVIPLMS